MRLFHKKNTTNFQYYTYIMQDYNGLYRGNTLKKVFSKTDFFPINNCFAVWSFVDYNEISSDFSNLEKIIYDID